MDEKRNLNEGRGWPFPATEERKEESNPALQESRDNAEAAAKSQHKTESLSKEDFTLLVYCLDPDHWLGDDGEPVDEDVAGELFATGSVTVKVAGRTFVLALSYAEETN